jgi:antitoxin component YwqK of YwqJK toxin-antitoxin module
MEWLDIFAIKLEKCGLRVNGLEQGLRFIRRFDGIVFCVQNYVDGKCHGYQYGWYSNGDMCYESYYIYGRKHGIQRGWHTKNRGWYEFIYDNGIKISEQRWSANKKKIFKS